MRISSSLWLTILTTVVVSSACGAGAGERRERIDGMREIEGIPCTDYAWYEAETGRFKGCTLAREIVVDTSRIPAGTKVDVDTDHKPVMLFLPHDTEIDGHVCRGEGHEYQTKLHPNGRLAFCNLPLPAKIDGVPCEKSTFWTWTLVGPAGVDFHDDGSLKGCLLAEDYSLDGTTYRKGTRFQRDAAGRAIAAPH
ncbi:MAG: hypothetical protein U0V87_14225 [Acidobacteriota bacterium]